MYPKQAAFAPLFPFCPPTNGKVTLRREEQPLKAPSPIVVTPLEGIGGNGVNGRAVALGRDRNVARNGGVRRLHGSPRIEKRTVAVLLGLAAASARTSARTSA